MDFKGYIEKFLYEQNSIGDLARDIKRDEQFPETDKYDVVKSYLTKMNAAPKVIQVAEKLLKMYSEDVL